MDTSPARWQGRRFARHLPLPAGRNRAGRHRIEARNRVLTAALRRPTGMVLRAAAGASRDPAGERAAVAAAAPAAN
ncbi:hypothetical protein ACN26Y_22230 [Micromonospora sp. WMMD558]|uniref:hypothetical protein n=1 Tax=unclassified Micromonospora TaxID=2617518 RepID=UPI0012B485F6|nr:hypothetical protein [Micromonospora sp. WMMC415]QGN48745.1 hypothetical protein GKC29_19245 [Micromonospora sp. WMMC415]